MFAEPLDTSRAGFASPFTTSAPVIVPPAFGKAAGPVAISVLIEFANLSPTIGSKLRKIYSSIQTEKFNEEAIKEMSYFNPGNPAFDVMANLISGLTNIPLDRAVNKVQNLVIAADSETEFWDSFALTLGWNTWDLGIEDEAKKVKRKIKEKKKAAKKRCTAIKSNGEQCKNKTTNKSGKCYAHDK